MTRTPLFALVALSCIVGCGRSADPVATGSDTLEPPLVQAYMQDDNTLSVAGVWALALDGDALQGTLAPKSLRSGTQNDDTYALGLDQFFRPSQLRLASVRSSGANVTLTFEVHHPFPAPSDPTAAPNGFSNRRCALRDWEYVLHRSRREY
jgi:hypothetical protein